MLKVSQRCNVEGSLNNRVAEVLRLLEENYGYSKSFLARVLGVDRSTIYNWINGRTRPRIEVLWKIEKMFELADDRFRNDGYSRSHMGPPVNYFTIRPGEENTVLARCLKKLTFYSGLLGLTYKVLIDDAAYIIRKFLEGDKVNGKNVGELTLAALKIASLRLYYKIDGGRLNAILNELDIEKYRFYLGVLASRFLL